MKRGAPHMKIKLRHERLEEVFLRGGGIGDDARAEMRATCFGARPGHLKFNEMR